MSEKRLEWKVGIFVMAGLALLAALMLSFSKGVSLFRPTYDVLLVASNVGGLKPQAQVLMSGVQIGNVTSAELDPDGKTVTVRMRIYEKYKIYDDAEFIIDSIGFLGDQYVSIRPRENKGKVLRDRDVVRGTEPFNIQEVARASLGFIQRIDETARKLDQTLQRIDRVVLNEDTLTDLSTTVSTVRQTSQRALETIESVDALFQSNGKSMTEAMTNLARFSRQLNELAGELEETIVTNRTIITAAAKNVESVSESAKQLLAGVEEGRGVIGALMADDGLREVLTALMLNANAAADNFRIMGRNVNERGLWSVIRAPKKEKEPETSPPPKYPGRSGN
jgi:phospholipid/cholesterol/gamma-HCH transport system substrate-binding protein